MFIGIQNIKNYMYKSAKHYETYYICLLYKIKIRKVDSRTSVPMGQKCPTRTVPLGQGGKNGKK